MGSTIINILLASLGLLGTLSAFGGKTWVEGNSIIYKRITKRGYLSLVSLILAFCLGIYKEVNTNETIDNKDDQITELKIELIKVQAQLSSYKDILTILRDESQRQQQVVMGQFITVNGTWNAPNFLYPGSIVKFYSINSPGSLTIRYGNEQSGYTEDKLNLSGQNDGIPYEIPIVGNSGENFEWSLIGKWEGKIFVFSSPRQRENDWSWQEESSNPEL